MWSSFADNRRIDVVVLRSGGRDSHGNPRPGEEVDRPGVLIGPGASSEQQDRSDTTNRAAVLYDCDTSFAYRSTDRIRVPAGSRMSGDWAVDGNPAEWPRGTEVRLVRA